MAQVRMFWKDWGNHQLYAKEGYSDNISGKRSHSVVCSTAYASHTGCSVPSRAGTNAKVDCLALSHV